MDEHTILVARFLTLHHIADEANPWGTLRAMKNPEDPMNYLREHRKHSEIPSSWARPETLHLLEGPPRNPDSSDSDSLSTCEWHLARFDHKELSVILYVICKPRAAHQSLGVVSEPS